MTRDEKLDELLAKEEIRDAMARYARGIDRRDESLVLSAYHEDAVDDHGFGISGNARDIAAIVRDDGKIPPFEITQHFLGQHLIRVDNDFARSEIYFVALSRHHADGKDWDMVAAGRYLDRWERREDGFRISRRKVVYDYIRTDAVQKWPGPDHDVPKLLTGGATVSAEANLWGLTNVGDASYDLLPRETTSTS